MWIPCRNNGVSGANPIIYTEKSLLTSAYMYKKESMPAASIAAKHACNVHKQTEQHAACLAHIYGKGLANSRAAFVLGHMKSTPPAQVLSKTDAGLFINAICWVWCSTISEYCGTVF